MNASNSTPYQNVPGHPPPVIKIAPSILTGNFANLAEEITRLEATACDYIHIDIMDGHFVNNLSFGAPMVKALRPYTRKFFDVHLMMSHPEKYLAEFIAAGSDGISIHKEITAEVMPLLQKIRHAGKKATLVLNPNTPVDDLEDYLPYIDQLLLMSVHPGFGGQKFIPATLEKGRLVSEKLRKFAQTAPNSPRIDLEIDGGVNGDNIAAILASGFNVIVAGSYIFNEKDLNVPINYLKQAKPLT